ncbi:MAG: twin-arginine translocase subunit TatB [Sphingobium sp.]|nr:twin-arginine translocase subunit TatB [Sphingobium sp.]
MFGIDSTELLLIVVIAVVVIGPKDLPRALYMVGKVVGQARAMARHFRTGIDAMVREAELEELQKQWARENERIMAEHPQPEMTEKQLVEGQSEAESAPDVVHEATAPIDPLVEAVKQSQTPRAEAVAAAEPAPDPAVVPGKDAAA